MFITIIRRTRFLDCARNDKLFGMTI